MSQSENTMGQFIKIPMGRFLDKYIHQFVVKLHWYDLVSSMHILTTNITLSNIVYNRKK